MKNRRLMQKLIAAAGALVLTAGLAPAALAAQSFSDVREGQWFKPYTDKVVDAGYMSGMGDGSFAPDGHLTLGQAAVLAYKVHSAGGGGGSLPQTGGAWYMPYYQYGLDNKLFTASQVPLSQIDRKATRYEMVTILDKAVPSSQMKAVNDLPDGFVPDLSESSAYGSTVYKWYRAGMLAGDETHRFNGSSNITRAEVSVILCQLTNLTDRIKLEAAPDPNSGSKPSTDITDAQALINEVVRLTNVERAKEGLPALKTFDALDEAAAIRAPETVKVFSHTRPDGSTCFTALDETGAKTGAFTYGENIAAGNSTAAATVEQWMNSPGHRANILNKDYTHIGVGYATGGQYRNYWVQMFVGRKDTTVPVVKEVTGVSLRAGKTELTVNETTTVTAAVSPSDAANKALTWTSSAPTVAKVDSKGQVTALSAGRATITATASNGVKGTVTVTVTEPKPSTDTTDAQALIDEVVRLTNVERAKEGLPALKTFDALDKAAAIRAPETVKVFSHTRPDGSTCFTALDETGAKQGAFTYGENIAAGNSTAAATVEQWMNSPGHRANILNKDYTHIGVGYASGGQYRSYWVQMFVGRKDSTVPVVKEVTGVTLRAGKTELTVDETTTVTAAVSPSDAADKTLTWTSSAPDVAKVDSKGQVTALSAGRATITAAASNGVKGTVIVTVTETKPEIVVTEVSLRAGKMELAVNETTTVTATVSPSNAADKTLTWTSSDSTVAKVDSKGQVTALSAGQATITAAASNGVKGTVIVTVKEAEPEPNPGTDTTDVQALIAEVVRLTNVERAKEGLPALKTFDDLDEAAAIRAPETVELFSHTRPDGSTCFTALDETGAKTGAFTYGENIAAGNSTAAATVEQWMNSPGHRENILNKDYTHIGVGYATGGQYRHYWVQMFVGKR